MKKIIVLLSAAFLLSATTLFANPSETTVSNKIKYAFNDAFVGAKEVKWYTDDNKTFTAKFEISNSKVTAFFNEDGTLLATSRYLQADQLPLSVSGKIAKRYADDSIYCIVEYSAGEGTVYFITLEGKNTWTTLKADRNGAVTVQGRLKKA
ncbi:hypothetical protein [Chitinophaga solisilvae]|uniref:Uncharacterized protein n=1 Tax=Chitinophaga solisilvae TaxID=1233460 RepID=A0A3S1AWP7_9BACT|nr:hypothetical protein [Chitinophaga solisilvae]NSL89140.1 hypothetical protein [Chitinophaga solisilvae]